MTNKKEFNLIELLSKLTPISKDLEKVIKEHSTIKTVAKSKILLKEGQISNECFFILNGCLKKYFEINGEERITAFYTEGQVVTPASYVNRQPSKYYISAVEETTVLFGNPDEEKEIYKKHPDLEKVTRIITENLMVEMSEEFDDWVSNTPEEKYLLLTKNRPDLLQRIPQYQIANYLGIKPESLSRIRKRLRE